MVKGRNEELIDTEHLRSFARRGRALDIVQQTRYQLGMQQWGLKPVSERLSEILIVGQAEKVTLEIGFGDGANLLAMARAYPDRLFLGVEVYISGILKVLRGIEEQQLSNLYLYDGDAWDLLSTLPDACLDQCYVLFPDPWPKRRHHKRRLLQVKFLRLLRARCTSEAKLVVATDWQEYAEFISKELSTSGCWRCAQCLELTDRCEQDSCTRLLVTKFESKGLAQQRTIYQFNCTACELADTPTIHDQLSNNN